MNNWPPGWADGDQQPQQPPPGTIPARPAGHTPGGYPPAPDADPTAVLPPQSGGPPAGAMPVQAPDGYPPQPPIGGAHGAPPAPVGPPPQRSPAGPGGPDDPDGPGGPRGPGGPGGPGGPSRRGSGRAAGPVNWKKRILIGLGVFVVLVIVFCTVTYFWASSQIRHQDVLDNYEGRPKASAGTTWLIVGSDSREGLDAEDRKKLHTGKAAGKRTDSMMLLHKGKGGTVLISLPRDSYVEIPAYKKNGKTVKPQKNKLNAAFDLGGASLLARTVEMSTGMRLDHYAEIGFGGFNNIVDAMDGVDICLKKPIQDKDSGADLKAGCQTLDGAQALSFVRARHFDANQDIGRMERQQQFLGAIAKKAKSPGILLNPFSAFPVADASLGSVIVDDDAGLFDLYGLFKDMGSLSGGNGVSTTVPIANRDYTVGKMSTVLWDDKGAKALFQALRDGRTVDSPKK
ncbi:LCP family protein [Embleya sp. NBC_00896]|uniref:LCP family protein n=1 Tax=Embleya sp. NBC_00896 TaxID=2975961 RepID=UPI003864067D|nr:LCP family protein [Embleya sp. NBC_00896]